MEIVIIGLGKMGLNMTTRLVRGGHVLFADVTAMRNPFGGHAILHERGQHEQ